MNIITELTIFLRKTRRHYRKTFNFNPNYKQPEKQVFVVNPVSLNYYQYLGFSKNFLIGHHTKLFEKTFPCSLSFVVRFKILHRCLSSIQIISISFFVEVCCIRCVLSLLIV
jgi:hypothetical protein